MRLTPFLFFLMMASTQASSLQLCPVTVPFSGGAHAIVMGADGTQQRIQVSQQLVETCQSLPLPVSAQDVIAIHPLPPLQAEQIGNRLIVQGVERDGTFIISSLTAGDERAQPQRRPMPIQQNLLTGLNTRTFGIEERVRAVLTDGKLRLDCDAGTKPAGVILSAPWYMTQAQARLHVSVEVHGQFGLAIADAKSAAKETAFTVGHIDTASNAALDFALPAKGLNRKEWHYFAISCPPHKASLRLDDLRLTPSGPVRGTRSGWLWNAHAWMEQADSTLAHAQKHGLRTLFISVPVTNAAVANPRPLAAFVQRASALGIAVWSVDGDPRMVLPQEHASAVARVRAYAAYNKAVEPAARLRGIQFDIEHYLLPGYETAATELDQHYVELTGALHRAAGTIPLEFVVPFWWNDKPELLKALATTASGLNVMDYRTDPAQITEFAQPFLEWGVTHGKTVRIALEAGPVAAEQQRRYVRADTGQAWLVRLDRLSTLVLLKEAQPNPHGPAFRLTSTTTLDGSATTFYKNPARMLEMLPELEMYFSAWTSFNGMALHEIR